MLMKCTLAELRNKEIIIIKNGARLGYIDDLEFDTETSEIKSFIVYGRSRFFGLLGKEDDIVITCGDIEIIGVDTVLIAVEEAELAKRYSKDIKSLLK
ncbi:MAG: YlmC/YmxH family sporulation protein [Oscillospiraceae bacterium]|nr:YlmC/YmxH family sporulation protein [Oscillospiraceae bacterium]